MGCGAGKVETGCVDVILNAVYGSIVMRLPTPSLHQMKLNES
jgi:hypothetical protein